LFEPSVPDITEVVIECGLCLPGNSDIVLVSRGILMLSFNHPLS